jgi:hypothetical protein
MYNPYPKETPMEPRKRTHLVNELMQEAHGMMAALEKAMQGERFEESHPALHGTHHAQGQYRLEDEHKAWENVLRALTDMQTELEKIEHSERQRTLQGTPSAHASSSHGVAAEGL